MRREALSSICGLALFIGGCPKRQAPTRIVYVPSPPAAAAPAPAASPQAVLIEEPAPPEAPQVSPQPTPAPKPPRRRRVLRTEPPPSNVEVTPQPTEPPPTPEVPALEPRESSAQETALRQQIQELRENVGRQISRLDKTQLSSADRKILEDARTFFAQSGRALEEGDLQRALTLARKASLLISALE